MPDGTTLLFSKGQVKMANFSLCFSLFQNSLLELRMSFYVVWFMPLLETIQRTIQCQGKANLHLWLGHEDNVANGAVHDNKIMKPKGWKQWKEGQLAANATCAEMTNPQLLMWCCKGLNRPTYFKSIQRIDKTKSFLYIYIFVNKLLHIHHVTDRIEGEADKSKN